MYIKVVIICVFLNLGMYLVYIDCLQFIKHLNRSPEFDIWQVFRAMTNIRALVLGVKKSSLGSKITVLPWKKYILTPGGILTPPPHFFFLLEPSPNIPLTNLVWCHLTTQKLQSTKIIFFSTTYVRLQRPILNFTPGGKLWPPGAKLSPRGEFVP
jgi:hypothetical protein